MTMMVRRRRRQYVAWPCDHGTGPALRDKDTVIVSGVPRAKPRKQLRIEVGRRLVV